MGVLSSSRSRSAASDSGAEGAGTSGEKGVAEALRTAIEGTLSEAGKRARAGSAALRPERATQLLDEVVRRGRSAGTSSLAGGRARA